MKARIDCDPLYGGRHFPQDIIVLCVRWYVTYRLSYRADSTACRAGIPRHAGPPFRGKPGRVRGDRTTSYRDLFGVYPGRSTVAQARLTVRRIREVLRLKAEARLSHRQIAAVIGSARSTVQECLRRACAAGIG